MAIRILFIRHGVNNAISIEKSTLLQDRVFEMIAKNTLHRPKTIDPLTGISPLVFDKTTEEILEQTLQLEDKELQSRVLADLIPLFLACKNFAEAIRLCTLIPTEEARVTPSAQIEQELLHTLKGLTLQNQSMKARALINSLQKDFLSIVLGSEDPLCKLNLAIVNTLLSVQRFDQAVGWLDQFADEIMKTELLEKINRLKTCI